MNRSRLSVVLLAAVVCAGCAHTPTVEEANAVQANREASCEAKGYKRGTQDFQTCLSLAMQEDVNRDMQTHAAMGFAAGMPVLLLGLSALSDVRAKDDIAPVGIVDGMELYQFRYKGGRQIYVGVIAQEIQRTHPEAITEGADGLLRVNYTLLGLRMLTIEQWKAGVDIRLDGSPDHVK